MFICSPVKATKISKKHMREKNKFFFFPFQFIQHFDEGKMMLAQLSDNDCPCLHTESDLKAGRKL